MVDEVLLAQRDGVDALAQQGLEAMLDERGIAIVAKAARDPPRQPDGPVRLAQQGRSSVRGDIATIELTHNLATREAFNTSCVALQSVPIGRAS